MTTVAILPLDDRPVNYDYPRYLGRAAGMEVLVPPRDWLGNPWRASRHAELIEWLGKVAPIADGIIVAIDTLAYGGLIPSRTSSEPVDAVLARMQVLKNLKAAHPRLEILGSSVLLRICRANSSEEEKPYWAEFGSRMFRLSFVEDKAASGYAGLDEIAERDRLRSEIPDEVYRDYRAGRARNHAVNRAMIDWLSDGVFDYLIIPQDDTGEYGWNIAEARSLQALIRRRNLADRSITYPGADEIGCLLLARLACRRAGFAPRVWPRYSGVTGPSIITDYEDRPIHELIKAHLAPLGGVIADSPDGADLSLFINAPVRKQGNGGSQWLIWQGLDAVRARLSPPYLPWFDAFTATEGFRNTRREMESPQRSPEEFVRALLVALASAKPVAMADVAYVNGSDLILGEQLRQHPAVAGLAAYGGWNTAGNTLGAVLAQAVIRVLALREDDPQARAAAHLEFLFLRFLDDDLYQASERTRCILEDLPAMGVTPSMERLPDKAAAAVEARIRTNLGQAASNLRRLFMASGLARDISVSHIHLPWNRLFEVGFDVAVEPGGRIDGGGTGGPASRNSTQDFRPSTP
ncbi:MAG TPA: DUF4127 family protein [Opitutaceae bacterium]|nr:DUF4127 family protein [Opitutaceae bacterium]